MVAWPLYVLPPALRGDSSASGTLPSPKASSIHSERSRSSFLWAPPRLPSCGPGVRSRPEPRSPALPLRPSRPPSNLWAAPAHRCGPGSSALASGLFSEPVCLVLGLSPTRSLPLALGDRSGSPALPGIACARRKGQDSEAVATPATPQASKPNFFRIGTGHSRSAPPSPAAALPSPQPSGPSPSLPSPSSTFKAPPFW